MFDKPRWLVSCVVVALIGAVAAFIRGLSNEPWWLIIGEVLAIVGTASALVRWHVSNKFWWLVAGIVVALVGAAAVFIHWTPSLYKNDGINYLLGAIAQSLASILAFTFVVSLAILQSLAMQTTRVLFSNRLFWVLTVSYALSYGGVMWFSLLFLKNPSDGDAGILLWLTFLLVLALPAYFFFLVQELAPVRLFAHLRSVVLKPSTNPVKSVNSLKAIHNIAVYSFHRGDYDSVELAMDTLLDLLSLISARIETDSFVDQSYTAKWQSSVGHKLPDSSKTPPSPDQQILLEAFIRAVHTVTISQNDPYIPPLLMSKINDWGTKIIDAKRYHLLDRLLIAEAVIAVLMAERLAYDAVWWSLAFLRRLGASLWPASASNMPPPQYLQVDYVASVKCLYAAVETHCPRFLPAVSSVEQAAATGFSTEVFLEGARQAREFLMDVFPDLI